MVRASSSSSTRSSPPGIRTVTGVSHQPFTIAAHATATALEPEALVSPAPRSQTATVTSCGPSTRTSWTFVRSGKRSFVSSCGPRRSSSSRSGSARTTACGLPTDTAVNSTRSPSTSTVSISPTSTSPTTIPIVPSSRSVAGYARSPTAIVTAFAPDRCTSQRAAIRLPLPENSATDPSGFQIAISACAPSVDSTSTTPSEPTP